jgi:hypothetical protein
LLSISSVIERSEEAAREGGIVALFYPRRQIAQLCARSAESEYLVR